MYSINGLAIDSNGDERGFSGSYHSVCASFTSLVHLACRRLTPPVEILRSEQKFHAKCASDSAMGGSLLQWDTVCCACNAIVQAASDSKNRAFHAPCMTQANCGNERNVRCHDVGW